jgi:hypothetical protein
MELPENASLFAELTKEQRELYRHLEQLFGGRSYHRYFTAERVAADLKGALHRHPQRIEAHLAVFAARGIILPVSRPREANTGLPFAACYRLPHMEPWLSKGEDGQDATISDEIRFDMMETQRNLAMGNK